MTSRVIVSLRIAASPDRTFEAFTREIRLWWRPNDLFPFTVGGPGVLSFEGGRGGRFIETLANGAVFEIGEITGWEPGERLAFRWRQDSFEPDQRTDVDVRFEAVAEGTRVTVEHRGWDSVPAAHVARHGFPDPIFLRRHGEWWTNLLAALKANLP